jgi:hypothetical protein
LKIIA